MDSLRASPELLGTHWGKLPEAIDQMTDLKGSSDEQGNHPWAWLVSAPVLTPDGALAVADPVDRTGKPPRPLPARTTKGNLARLLLV